MTSMRNSVPIEPHKQAHRWAQLLACLLVSVSLTPKATAMTEGTIHTIVIEGMQYSPMNLEVRVGDTVIWENKDPFPHTATSNDGTLDSGNIESGSSWKFKVKTTGSYPYVCALHPTMKAQLIVK